MEKIGTYFLLMVICSLIKFIVLYKKKKKINIWRIFGKDKWKKDKNNYLTKYCYCNTCKELLIVNNDINALFLVNGEQSKEFKRGNKKVTIASSWAQKLTSRHFIHNKNNKIKKWNICKVLR